jgi:hypothetical protein
MKKIISLGFVLLSAMAFFSCGGGSQVINKTIPPAYNDQGRKIQQIYSAAQVLLENCKSGKLEGVEMVRHARLDTLMYDREEKTLDIYFNRYFAYRPLREESVKTIYDNFKAELGGSFDKYDITLYSTGLPIHDLIPNYFIENPEDRDTSKFPVDPKSIEPIVRNNSKPFTPSKGLNGRHIALWNSHGWYYENSLHRWEWQRARNFQVVEDIFPTSYVLQYLVPMLENAGANTFLPRERDVNINEVIVDNDDATSAYSESGNWENGGIGFAVGEKPYVSGDNPFRFGTYRQILANDQYASAEYKADIPESGEYAVYISYHHSENNVDDAKYIVYHAGGRTEFLVNQQMGGETWIYLGKFKFFKDGDSRVVIKTNRLSQTKYITTDAIRFGGGMGDIMRNGLISERPRWVEAARYYLQYAGMPEMVYNIHQDTVDYNDDYKSRGEWVNYLKGAPFGPTANRDTAGLGIPIDLSFAFHTDAGTTRNDTVIGTLMIYSRKGGETNWDAPGDSAELTFPDGQSRYVNRDLADIIQTQIVEDIYAKYDPAWNRRGMWDAAYSEAWRPNVPGALLELHSHHNFLDMKFGNDPQFRFDASRAIYKGMLRFLSTQYGYEYVVQPLPPSHVMAEVLHGKVIRIKWQPVLDPLESTAVPEKYMVYTRKDSGGWDDGILLDAKQCMIPTVDDGVLYSFKVTALNDGGESFPSEIVSVCNIPNTKKVLVVNAFDRVSGPEILETDKYLGFMDAWGKSVPDVYDLSYIGSQYDFLADSKWLDDDSPGNGASYGNMESTVIVGNTHDYPYLHGQAIVAAGYSFDSASDEAVALGMIELEKYETMDIIYGEQKATPWPKPIKEPRFRVFPRPFAAAVEDFTQMGGNVFLSGAYIGTDILDDTSKISFAERVLKYRWRTDHASLVGDVYANNTLLFGNDINYSFITDFHPKVYGAENPDGIEPAKDSGALTVMRYTENNISAGIAWNGEDYNTFVIGFPFECIPSESSRNTFMKRILDFFENDQNIDQAVTKDGRKKSSVNK